GMPTKPGISLGAQEPRGQRYRHEARKMKPARRPAAMLGAFEPEEPVWVRYFFSAAPSTLAYSMKPIIISSQVCSPKRTDAVGSGFQGLPLELSKWARHLILVRLGRCSGSFR